MGDTLPVVILISGRGSNLQAILEQTRAGYLPIDIKAVISNRPDAAGLQLATALHIKTECVDHTDFDSREAFDQALQTRIDQYQPELVVLAGFMRILTPAFVKHFRGRMLNIHPSLLPRFQGLNTHQRALDAGEQEHGASIHFVTEELDGGPVIAQACINIEQDDTAETLAERVLQQEHVLYPEVIRWFADKRLALDGNRVILDGKALHKPVSITP